MGKFQILLADPAWRYEQKRLSGAAEKHYSTMHIDDICALPVANLAAADSVLFLWSTFALLPEALRVIKAWQFQFKTVAFVWLKKNKVADSFFYGLGFWTRGNVEVCLLATRGRPKRQNAGISQLIISPVEAHSKKPDIVRDKIVELMGDIPRIELFARERTPGWEALGYEIDGQDIRAALKEVIDT
jgi:N6-adenosine-specific RNA methylase IME4